MAFRDCVEAAVRAGRISREQAEDLYSRQADAEQRFTLDPQHSAESARRMASELATEQARQRVRLQRYQAGLQAISNSRNRDRILRYERGPNKGIQSLLTRDPHALAQWGNVDIETRNILAQSTSTMAEGLSQLRTRWLGFDRDNRMLNNVVHELFGTATGDKKAAAFAKAWAKAAEDMRLRFNRAGGAIPKRADWGMSQNHDSVLVGAVERGEWVDFVMGRLNIEQMIDVETGSAFTPASLEVVLQGVYDTIRTNGVVDMIPGQVGGRKLANRRQDARFLIFKDSQSWLEYQQRFGDPNLFATMAGHLDSMARDIALLEAFGPNPAAGFRYLQDIAGKMDDKPLSRVKNQAAFNIVAGTSDSNRSPTLAHVMGAGRSWNVFTKLGAASVSALTDMEFMKLTAQWSGLEFTKVMGQYLKQLNPANEADRILATQIGIPALSWTQSYSNVGRFSEIPPSGGGTMLGKVSHVGNRIAEAVVRGTGLSAMTDAGRRAFAMVYASELASNFTRTLDQIEPKFRATLTSKGMTEAEWDIIRQTRTTDFNNVRYFTVDQLMERTDLTIQQRQHLASQIQMVLNEEIFHAVPEPDAAVRIYTTGGRQRGTPTGELIRQSLQFKSFPIAVLSTHMNRVRNARRLRGGLTPYFYAAEAIVATTLLGYVAMSLKQIAYGKDPRNIDDPRTWAAAVAQGGSIGIYGGFFFTDQNRFGHGLTATILGPTAGIIDDTARLTFGNLQQGIAGEETQVIPELINYTKRYMPGGNVFYGRLLLEREIFDQLSLWADPSGTRKKFRRKESIAREQGSDYWWRPGETTPHRAPDMELIE